MELSNMVMWLIAGVVLFFAEMGLPGVGLLFAGCGALTVGMLLDFSVITQENILLQILVFLVATAAWTLILWKPIQKLKMGKNKASYNNIIGETATVSEKGMNKTHGGDVIWSGAIMKAKFAANVSVERLESGSLVVIKDIAGNVLTVAPK